MKSDKVPQVMSHESALFGIKIQETEVNLPDLCSMLIISAEGFRLD